MQIPGIEIGASSELCILAVGKAVDIAYQRALGAEVRAAFRRYIEKPLGMMV